MSGRGTPTAADFPAGTPLHHFFRWNERRWRHDRRYRLMRSPERLPPPVAAALDAAIGSPDIDAHAAVFAAFEALEASLPGPRPAAGQPRRILVIRLSALGDLVQALGPFAAIRGHHRGDHITLLTTRPYAAFAAALGWFDAVLVDERPSPPAVGAWLRLRRELQRRRFDRVYDLQTSRRSGLYAALLRLASPRGMPQWSGIAWRSSHPHANLERDAQHTLDKQAEQLLMAGIHPTPPPALPPLAPAIALPAPLAGARCVLLAPGSSPRHPEKRWPAARFGALAARLAAHGLLPVVVGVAAEAPLAAAIRAACPAALDLVGQTDLSLLTALAQQASLTVGNDTGICHLAAAAGGPVIVLFSRATDPARHAPRGARVRILAMPALADLGVEPVAAAALAALTPPLADRRGVG